MKIYTQEAKNHICELHNEEGHEFENEFEFNFRYDPEGNIEPYGESRGHKLMRFLSQYEINAVCFNLFPGEDTHDDWEVSKEELLAELKELIKNIKAN